MANGITYSPGDRVLAQPPELYKLSDPGIIRPEGKEREFLGTHNFKKDELYANHFQRVRATKDEFEGIADGYTAFFDIVPADENYKGKPEDYKGPYTAKLKPGKEVDFHEVFQREASTKLEAKDGDKDLIKKAKNFLKHPIDSIFKKDQAKLDISKEELPTEGPGKYKFTIKAGNSAPTGDHVEVDKRSATDKSRPWKIFAGFVLALVGVAAVAVIGPAVFFGALTTALTAFYGLGFIGGAAVTTYLGKKLALLKSPWWGKTAEGQIQKLAREQSKELGENFSKMVRNQMALDHTKTKLVGSPVEAQAPALCEPEKLQNFLLLAKNKKPEDLKAEIRSFLLDEKTSFLDKSTIDRAKGGTGWFFAGGKKAHAEKTVNIVTDEIYKGIIRGLGEGYLDLLEAAVADQKTLVAQGVFKEAILPAVSDFQNAIEAFRREDLDGAVRGGETTAFEIHETDDRISKLQGYQSRAPGFLQAIDKNDSLGAANVEIYKEVLKGFDEDIAKHLKSLETVKSLISKDDNNPSSLGTIQDSIGDLLSDGMRNADQITGRKEELLGHLAEARKKINSFNQTPELLEVHHEALLKTVTELESAINGAADIASTLATIREDLKQNAPTRDTIENHLKKINQQQIPNLNPLNSVETNAAIEKATGLQDTLIKDLKSISSLYKDREWMLQKIDSQIGLAEEGRFADAMANKKDSDHAMLLAGFETQKSTLESWANKGYASPQGLNPDNQQIDYLRNMAGGAAGIPKESRGNFPKILEKLCNIDNATVLSNLKESNGNKIEHLQTIESLLGESTHENASKNACQALRTARSIYPQDTKKALGLTQSLFTGAGQNKLLARYDQVGATLNGLKELFNGDVGTRLYGWAQSVDEKVKKPENFDSASFLGQIVKFQKSIGHDSSSTERLALSLNGVSDEVALLDQLDILDSLPFDDLKEISVLQQTLEGQIIENERLVELNAMASAFEADLDDGKGKPTLAEVIKQYAQVKPGMQEQANEIGQNLKQNVELTADVKTSITLQNAQAEQAMKYLAEVFRTDPKTIQKAVQTNQEIAKTVQQFLHVFHAWQSIEQSGLSDIAANKGFSQDDLKNGIKTLASCSISVVPDQNSFEDMSTRDYSSFKQRLEDRNRAINAAKVASDDKSVKKFLKSHRTVLEKFLYEEKAYNALLGQGELHNNHRIALEQISPNPMGRDNQPIVRAELLISSRINSVQQQLQNNIKTELECSQALLIKNPSSEFLVSQVQHLQENIVGDTSGIKDAYKNAHLGGAVSIGQRLVASERMKGLSPDQITASLQKEEFESLKKALKYINPKQMELQRPGLFMRLVNRILRRETGVEKLMSRVVDVPKAKEDLATLARHGIATDRLEEQLKSLELTQKSLQTQRDGLLNNSDKAKVAINYLAAEHLAAKVVSDPDAKLSSDDIAAIKSNWLNLAGNDDLWSDFSTILKEGTGFDDLMKGMSDEQRIAYQKSLTEIQEGKALLKQKCEAFRDALFEARSALFIPIKGSDLKSSINLLDNEATWVKKTQPVQDLRKMPLNQLLQTMTRQLSDQVTKEKLLKDNLLNIGSIYNALDLFYAEFAIQRESLEDADNYSDYLNERKKILSEHQTNLEKYKDEISKLEKLAILPGSVPESLRRRLTQNQNGSTALDEIVGLINNRINNLKNLCDQELKKLDEDNNSVLAQRDDSEVLDLNEGVNDLAQRFDLSDDLKKEIIEKYESSPENFVSLQSQLLNVKTILDGQSLIRNAMGLSKLEIEEKPLQAAQVPARQPAANSVQAPPIQPQVPQQNQSLVGTLSTQNIGPFAEGDNEVIQKRANKNWSELTRITKAFENNLPYLQNYQHVAVEGKGFCSLTAMATFHGMKTSELVARLQAVAQETNQEAVLKEILQKMNTDSSGFELTKDSYQKLFADAGLSFWVLTLNTNKDVFNAAPVGKQTPDANAPALLFTKQLSSEEGHFDLLAPPNHLAGKVNLPTDAQKYVKNDFKLS